MAATTSFHAEKCCRLASKHEACVRARLHTAAYASFVICSTFVAYYLSTEGVAAKQNRSAPSCEVLPHNAVSV